MTNDFYVTLPSNASMQYFPQNTQSSYRTKLVSPLMLNGEWEVGLSEIFIPRNWFNIGDHNSSYTVYLKTSKSDVTTSMQYQISFAFDATKSLKDFFNTLGEKIKASLGDKQSVSFILDAKNNNVTIDIARGFELHISKSSASKFLYILHLPTEDCVIKETTTFRCRATSDEHEQVFTIVNKNLAREIKHIIPLSMKGAGHNAANKDGVFSSIQKSIEWLQLQNYVTFRYDPVRNEIDIIIAENAELHITEQKARSLLRILHHHGNIVVKGSQKFQVNPLISIRPDENMELIIRDYPIVTKYEKEKRELFINEGSYNSAEALFREFQYIRLKLLPNQKVYLKVPDDYEVTFGRGLADMLGFAKNEFNSGVYTSKYPLELNGGITEIFIYTDLIESHRVGDTYVPLLRIIPCMNEKNDQIVKHYEPPVYFPLRKHFVDTIEIELKTIAGRSIIFTGGKTFVLLSFRRKKNL